MDYITRLLVQFEQRPRTWWIPLNTKNRIHDCSYRLYQPMAGQSTVRTEAASLSEVCYPIANIRPSVRCGRTAKTPTTTRQCCRLVAGPGNIASSSTCSTAAEVRATTRRRGRWDETTRPPSYTSACHSTTSSIRLDWVTSSFDNIGSRYSVRVEIVSRKIANSRNSFWSYLKALCDITLWIFRLETKFYFIAVCLVSVLFNVWYSA